MKSNAFLQVFYEIHQAKKRRELTPRYPNFDVLEDIFLCTYGLGKYETYFFLYAECENFEHFNTWLAELKGLDFLAQAGDQFKEWLNREERPEIRPEQKVLHQEQLQFWEEHGYLKVSGLIEPSLCEDVKAMICKHMDVSLSDPDTWYRSHADWHGLMLQVYQDASLEAIRKHPHVYQLFSELYGSRDIIANTEKVSFNPPVTENWKFSSGALHWDIDISKPLGYYIQGLIYLDDVPADRGPLTLVPGVHLEFDKWIRPYSTLDEAHNAMRNQMKAVPVPGKKGDIIVWRNTLPHAASANHSVLPRFVQYLSFSKL
ncbi:phytanoyl-CoA dioxygenase family protein [Pedobacter sp. MC2016-24]|uniref:phytanoyl-CoA dioxygenase family protein n=1 Tax=Pedobacter sp. MC2016-24 TaxID=2780090 RepID=UPI0018812BB4|nr:phytanoyl-CoA dioxygenase family protein [Pedobacter sp. MC2016-24]MBE9601769.1 phytanoyl-CoA dioxygenase family protein [Pedobacter sp. MC2016-24]